MAHDVYTSRYQSIGGLPMHAAMLATYQQRNKIYLLNIIVVIGLVYIWQC